MFHSIPLSMPISQISGGGWGGGGGSGGGQGIISLSLMQWTIIVNPLCQDNPPSSNDERLSR